MLIETAVALPVMAAILGGSLLIATEATLRARADRVAATAAIVWLAEAVETRSYGHALPRESNGSAVCAAIVSRDRQGRTSLVADNGEEGCPVPPSSHALAEDEIELVVTATQRGLPLSRTWTGRWRASLPSEGPGP